MCFLNENCPEIQGEGMYICSAGAHMVRGIGSAPAFLGRSSQAKPAGAWWMFAFGAIVLTWLTLTWRIPLLLWDNIDLVPIYQAWEEGRLGSSDFWKVHDGSHLHSAAYAILLLTTRASGGQTWLDCLVSMALLGLCGAILLRMALRDFGARLHRGWLWVFVFLALYPGHLINLQWGWQVAVFVGLLGCIAPVYLLTAPRLTWGANLLAVILAVAGVFGFSTTLVAFPVAVGLIVLHRTSSAARRLGMCAPWLAALALLVALLHRGKAGAFVQKLEAGPFVGYVFNYLGGGVMHFSNEVAPVFAAIALGYALWVSVRMRLHPSLLPWLSLMAMGVGFAILTACGRATLFGAGHGFAIRYASFSIWFWIGWLGVMLVGFRDSRAWTLVRGLLLLFVAASIFNGLHLARKAMKIAEHSRQIAMQIREDYPHIDRAVLSEAYDWRAGVAEEQLRIWHAHGYAPFQDGRR
ncbi:hypothetical protein [Xanthomonas theicola]|uniref:hypothetical protein n=1 Tax=Xanthomonas theicola TaxID=56464 RepID=UPI000FF89355|nr:hypothetical protein [Xanthomonas theicola]